MSGEPGEEVDLPAALEGERLDRALATISGCSRSEAAAWIERGAVSVDGAPAPKASLRVSAGQRVRFPRPRPEDPAVLEPDPSVPVTVLHEDEHLLVVDKPAPVVVHPGAGRHRGTLVQGLLARYPEIGRVGEPDRPGIVHRLDRGTSGLLVVARTEPARVALVEALAERRVRRRYWALVLGVPDTSTGTVDAPIGRSPRRRTAMAVVEGGRPARTHFRVEAAHDEPVPTAELACDLETGRTHQIRVHLASIGHPVLGDRRYGRVPREPVVTRLCLHARRLSFVHPATGERLTVESPLPEDLARVVEQLS